MSHAETIARSAAQTASTSLQRLKAIEEAVKVLQETLKQVIPSVNNQFAYIQDSAKKYGKIVEAIASLIGPKEVEIKLKEIVQADMEEAVEEQKKAVAISLEQRIIVKADVVTEDSFIVGKEFDKDGNVIAPGRNQFFFKEIKPAIQVKVLGLIVGSIITTEDGSKFEIEEIYAISKNNLH